MYAFPFFYQLDVHRFLPFGIMAGLSLSAAIVCMTLPETFNQPTLENFSQDKKKPEHDENRNATDDKGEEGKECEDTLL